MDAGNPFFGMRGFFLTGDAYDMGTDEPWIFQMAFAAAAATAATIVSGTSPAVAGPSGRLDVDDPAIARAAELVRVHIGQSQPRLDDSARARPSGCRGERVELGAAGR